MWRCCCRRRRRRRRRRGFLKGSFSVDDGDGNDNATGKQFDWSSEENKRAARVARTYDGSVPSFPKQQREIIMFTVVLATWAYNCTALILCI